METSASFEARYAPLPYPTNQVKFAQFSMSGNAITHPSENYWRDGVTETELPRGTISSWSLWSFPEGEF
jgi:hypothetical protein